MPIVLEEEVEILRREAAERGFDLYFEYVGTHRGVKLFRWIIRGGAPFIKISVQFTKRSHFHVRYTH